MFQNATFLRKSEPGPLTSLMNMSLALRLPHDMHLSRSSSNVPRLPTFWNCRKTFTVCSCVARCRIPCACHTEHASTSQNGPSMWCFFYLLTSKCASRQNGAQISISHPARWLRTSRFSEPTFLPCGGATHWKNTMCRDFSTFSRTCNFFLLTLCLL